MANVIKTQFEIIRIQTMASGSIRYVFETRDSDLETMQKIAECRLRGAMLEAALVPIDMTKVEENAEKTGKIHF